MCTGALDLVSCAGVGIPWLLSGEAGDLVIMGLDMLARLSCWAHRKGTLRNLHSATLDEAGATSVSMEPNTQRGKIKSIMRLTHDLGTSTLTKQTFVAFAAYD